LSSKVERVLNKQIKIEAEYSQLYLAMASWVGINGFKGVA
jgi:ferritin